MTFTVEMTQEEFDTLHDGTVQPPPANWRFIPPFGFKRSKGERWFFVYADLHATHLVNEVEIRLI